jgi:hypothetical protein
MLSQTGLMSDMTPAGVFLIGNFKDVLHLIQVDTSAAYV